MQQNLPFNFKEVFKLTNLGLNPELFKFGSVTLESSKYVCVKDAAVSIQLGSDSFRFRLLSKFS